MDRKQLDRIFQELLQTRDGNLVAGQLGAAALRAIITNVVCSVETILAEEQALAIVKSWRSL
jgi:hypothetical protein